MRFRLNLPELEDQPWLPRPLRNGMLDALRWFVERAGVYRAIVPRLAEAVRRTGALQLVDLGSGGGGGLRQVQVALSRALGRPVPVVMTDRYPNLPAFRQLNWESKGKLLFRSEPVDARAVPADLTGFRTIFSTFHHFPPPVAWQILADAVAKREGIGVFEGAGKHWWELALLWGIFPPLLLLATPFLKPFRFDRLALTYLVPLIPAGVVWDGTASLLRLYPPDRLRQLAREADPDGLYDWEAGTQSAGIGRSVTYLIGVPKVSP